MASSVLTTLVRCFKAERAELFYYGLVRVNNACSLFQGGEREQNYFIMASSVLTTLVRCFKAERAATICLVRVNNACSLFQGGENWIILLCLVRGGGGAPPLLKVIGTCRWTGYDFAGHQYWHRVSNGPNVVITIDTGYQIGLMWSSPLTQGIKIGLLGYGGLLVYHRITCP